MILSTSEIKQDFEVLGIVRGNVVQTRHIGRDILAGLKTIVGGEVKTYSDLMTRARNLATERMVEEAKKLDADAIICVKYATANVMQGAAEILAYGTAVKFK